MLENILNRIEAVLTTDRQDQITENFPVIPGLDGRSDGGIEALEPAGGIDHTAAFLGGGGEREDDVRSLRSGIGEDVAGEEEIQPLQIFGGKSGFLEEIFLPNDEGLDVAGLHCGADGGETGGIGSENEFGAVGVGVLVGGDQVVVGFANAIHDGDEVGLQGGGETFHVRWR